MKSLKSLAVLFFGVLFLAMPVIAVVSSLKASAVIAPEPSAGPAFDPAVNQHIDRSTILYNKVYYFDDKIDDNYTYFAPTVGGCTDKIDTLKNSNSQATLHSYKKDPTTGKCHETKTTITLANTDRAVMPFDIIDATTIRTSDKHITYTYNSDLSEYLESGGDKCKDIVKITAGPDSSGATLSVLASTGGSSTSYDKWSDQVAFDYSKTNRKDDCTTYGPNTYRASTVYFINQEATSSAPNAGTSADGSSDSGAPSCESSGLSLSWIFCPVINGLGEAIDGVYADLIQPLLITKPLDISANNNDPNHTYEIWSSFRIFGDIFLVIALLVVVFGQSIGGGLIDAYAAKKILPRLLIAAVMINISLYVVALAVDITNIIGNGIAALIEAPFRNNNDFVLHMNGGSSGIGLTALIGGSIWAVSSAVPLLQFLFVFVLIPAFFVIIAILATVLLRRGLIVLLVMLAPVAFALYCLPNTEQYFKKWWDLLLRTLMIYPIIAVIFAIGNILSVTINSAGQTSGVTATLSELLSIIALIVPLAMIPFSFRLAGGLLGKIHDTVSGFGKQGSEFLKGNQNDMYSRRNMARRALANRNLSYRERAVEAGVGMQKKRGRIRNGFGRSLAGVAGAGNYEVRRSLKNKEAAEMVQNQVSSGGDNTVRALFGRKMQYKDSNGNEHTGWFKPGVQQDANGFAIGKDSPDFVASEVAKAKQLFGRDPSGYQGALTYEVGKAADDAELSNIMKQHVANVKESGPLGVGSEGGNIWIGTAFSHQQSRRELKHTSFDPDDRGGKLPADQKGKVFYKRNSKAFTKEVAENVGNYPLSNMRTSTIQALEDDFDNAQAFLTLNDPRASAEARQQALSTQARLAEQAKNTGVTGAAIGSVEDAREIVRNVQLTADSLDSRYQQTGSFALAGEGDGQTPVSGAQTGAAGKVNEKIQALVSKASTRRPGPSGGGSGGGGGIIVPPSNYSGSQG